MKVLTYWRIENTEKPRTIFFGVLEITSPERFITDGIKEGYRVFTLEMESQIIDMLNKRLRDNDNVIDEGVRLFSHEDPWTLKVLSEGTEVTE